jgi:TPR repeat protein
MSGELRAVSRVAHKPKALSRKTKAIALAKAVGTVVGLGTLAAGAAYKAYTLYTSPSDEEASVDGDESSDSSIPRIALIKSSLRESTASRASAQNEAGRTPPADEKSRDAESKRVLAELYYEGSSGVTLDKDRALGLYEQAATNGNKEAQLALGDLYRDGHVYNHKLRQNKDTAAAWYRLAADPSQFLLHGMLGHHTNRETETSEVMVRAVAALATLYTADASTSRASSGMQKRESAKQAAETAKAAWYATMSDRMSALTYGAILDDEYDTARGTQETALLFAAADHPAHEWYTAAARMPTSLTEAEAKLRLAYIEDRAGAAQKALKLREEAANGGNDRAQFLVASRLDGGTPSISESEDPKQPTKEQKDKALKMFRRAAKQGNVEAMLALIHLDKPKSDESAERWCQLAIAEGSAEASFEYGQIMMRRQKYDEALRLFITAADFGVTKAHNQADEAASRLRPALADKIDIQVFPTSSICDQELAVIVEPARLAKFANSANVAITEEAGAAYEYQATGTTGRGMHVTHVASPSLPSNDEGQRDRRDASSRLAKAYTNVLRVFVGLVKLDETQPPKQYKLRLRPIVLESDRALWAEPNITADAIRTAVRKVPEIARLISQRAVTMHVFEGYSAVLEYKAAFGLLDNSKAPSYGARAS